MILAIATFVAIAMPALAQTRPPQKIIQIGSFCFRKVECETHNATFSPRPDPVCMQPSPGHNLAAVTGEFIYNCYAGQEPVKLQVSIGGFTVTGIETYLQRLFIFLVGVSGIVAGVMIVWAGVKWLTSAGIPDRITDAKKKIGNALVGLLLVLASYVILQTVNPALVSLRLPPIKIPRPSLIATEDWCVNRNEFQCGGDAQHLDGQYECSDPAYVNAGNPPCGQPKAGACYGQWCESGGCHTIIEEKYVAVIPTDPAEQSQLSRLFQSERVCADASQCNNCDLAIQNSDNSYNIGNIALCASSACKCFMVATGILGRNVQCVKQKPKGESCDLNEECESRNCNFGESECGPSPNGEGCADDEDCDSGICNTVDEASLTSGVCRAPHSLPSGINEDCDRGALCRSGYRCINETAFGIDVPVPPGGPYSGPQLFAEIATGNAECQRP